MCFPLLNFSSAAKNHKLSVQAWDRMHNVQCLMGNVLCMTSTFNIEVHKQVYLREREKENPDWLLSEVPPTLWQLI